MTNDSKTDHAAKVATILGNLTTGDLSTAEGWLAVAQVHATLALVEQQRIANLIAWTTTGDFEPSANVIETIEKGLGL